MASEFRPLFAQPPYSAQVSVGSSTGLGSVIKISGNCLNTAAITFDGQLWVWGEGANMHWNAVLVGVQSSRTKHQLYNVSR